MVPLSVLKPWLPMEMLLLPLVFECKALTPMAMLPKPVVLLSSANEPMAMFWKRPYAQDGDRLKRSEAGNLSGPLRILR
jgi:hypothetical protein